MKPYATREQRAWTYGTAAADRSQLREHPGALFEARGTRETRHTRRTRQTRADGGHHSERDDKAVHLALTVSEASTLVAALSNGENNPDARPSYRATCRTLREKVLDAVPTEDEV